MAIQHPLPALTEHPEHNQAQHHPPPAPNISPAQSEALKIHNQARAAASKSTADPRPDLLWDPHLAAAAQEWAHHLAARDAGLRHSTGAERPGQGENLYWTSAGGTLAGACRGWVDERRAYRGERIGEGDFEGYGHYTQVIWPSTTRVGVAMAETRDGASFVVGRYSGPGNWTGLSAYTGR